METAQPEFEACYKTYYERLYRVAYRIAGNREDAEDALQEAYINAFKSFDRFRGQSALGTWLYRITVNSTLKYIKKRRSYPITAIAKEAGMSERDFFEHLKGYESVEDTVLAENMREVCLQMFLECMPKQQRIAFVLKVLMELPGKETAQIMDISEGAVKTNVYRARRLIQSHMADRCSLVCGNNPCKCGLWTAHALKNNKADRMPETLIGKNPNLDYKSLYLSEMSFLGKVVKLYDVQPLGLSREAFIEKMRKLVVKGSLKLFS